MPLSEKARHTIHYLRIRGSCFFPPWVIWLHISISFYFTFHYMSQLITFHPHVLFRFIQIFISEIPQSQYWNISSLLVSEVAAMASDLFGSWFAGLKQNLYYFLIHNSSPLFRNWCRIVLWCLRLSACCVIYLHLLSIIIWSSSCKECVSFYPSIFSNAAHTVSQKTGRTWSSSCRWPGRKPGRHLWKQSWCLLMPKLTDWRTWKSLYQGPTMQISLR